MNIKDLIRQEIENINLFNPVGILVMSTNEGKYLLLKRNNKVGEYKSHWAFVGGGVEKGEDPEEATLREVKEEIKYKPDNIKYFGKLFFKNRPIYVYTSIVKNEFEPSLNYENIDYGWFTYDEVKELTNKDKVIPNVLQILKDIENGDRIIRK